MLGGTLVDNMEHANEVPESARFKLRFFRTLSNLSIFSSINTTLRFLDITKLIREKAYQYSGEMYDCRCGSAFSIFITWNNQDQIWYVSCEDRLNYYACFLEPFRLGL
jgi:hypothetical protein